MKVLNNGRQINQQELKLIEKNVDIKGQTVLDVADLEDWRFGLHGHLLVVSEMNQPDYQGDGLLLLSPQFVSQSLVSLD